MTKKHIQQIVIIILASTLVGLAWNARSVQRYFKGEFERGFLSTEESSAIIFISLPEAESLFASREAVFLDSRSIGTYLQGHIQEAVHVPFETVFEVTDEILASLPHDKILVIYCDGLECQSSINLARYLFQKGFSNLKVFFGGWMDWKNAGLPVSGDDD